MEKIDKSQIPVRDLEHTKRLFIEFAKLEEDKSLKLNVKEYSNCTCRLAVEKWNKTHDKKLVARQSLPYVYIFVK